MIGIFHAFFNSSVYKTFGRVIVICNEVQYYFVFGQKKMFPLGFKPRTL